MASLSSSPPGQISPDKPPQESCIAMSDSDIPSPAYRQPPELIKNRENCQVDREIISMHLFGSQTDPSPQRNGVQEIGSLIKILEHAEIPCCIAAEAALLYYGSKRVMKEWMICVPNKQFEKAVDLVRANKSFEPFISVDLDFRYQLRSVFPHFKFIGLNLFFRIVPGKLYLLDVKPDNIERSQTGLPYPTLAHLAQGLLDTYDGVDLTDLVDGMNLSMEWGKENLDLEGTIPVDWGIWNANTMAGCKAPPEEYPVYVSDPPKRQDIWSRILDPERRKRRMGFKYPQDIYETRFRLIGSRDPRSYKRDWI